MKLRRNNVIMTIFKHRRTISIDAFRTLVTPNQKAFSTVSKQDQVLFDTVGTVGIATLNRPNQLNIQNYEIWKLLLPQAQEWEQSCSHLIIKGAGNVFSAGGDIKWVANPEHDLKKYAYAVALMNGLYLLSNYKIPYIALMDGVTFGGGCSLALHGRYRVATERTLVSTPETRIGWVTDASATYLLPRLDNHFGIYMGLTGKLIKGIDVAWSGIATHFVPSAHLERLQSDLCSCSVEDIEDRLNAYSEPLGEFSLAPFIKDIDYCFSADTVEEIIERLLKVDNSWSKDTLETLAQMCPTSLKVSLRALQYGKVSGLKQCLRMEFRMLSRVMKSYNAMEGIRALLVEKDGKPKWQPASLAEVTESTVDSYFEPLLEGEELPFVDDLSISLLGAMPLKYVC